MPSPNPTRWPRAGGAPKLTISRQLGKARIAGMRRAVRWLGAILVGAALAACGGGGSSERVAPANEAPSVSIDAPAPGASYTSTDTIRLTASASDRDGRVVRVEFISDSQVIGDDVNAPFEFIWTNPPPGTHTLSVRAIDDAGAATLSASRQVTIAAPPPPNRAPTVAIAAPANNFKANAATAVLLSASADDSDGGIAKVEFFRVDPAAPVYDASTLVGLATAVGSPPTYQLQTAPLSAGAHHFVARATDDRGAVATSASVQVLINALPIVSITSPAPGATVVPGTTVTLRATASDADGSISKVEFFLNNGAIPIGSGVRGPGTDEYTLNWTTTLQGSYAFIARATDNDGAQQSTGSVAVNVPANVLPSVTLDDPVAGTNAPTNLALSASASDADGSIVSVQFSVSFNGTTSLSNGTFDAGKWRLSLPIAARQPTTIYTISAIATDNLGGQRTAPSKSVTVAANVPPAVNLVNLPVRITLPTGTTSTTVNLGATASDSDGIARVEFLEGATKLGEATAQPYQIAWNNVVAGTYAITARAIDAVGSAATSAPQTLVVAPNALPTVTLEDPVAGANAPTDLSLTASAADTDGSVVSVQFRVSFNGATSLISGTFDAGAGKWRLSLPIAAAQPTTTYTVTAIATDNLGGQGTTTPKTVTVAANEPPNVALTSPANVTLPPNTNPGPITLSASASDSDGIARVEFYSGAVKVGEATSAPYQVTWSGVGAGSYAIKARAIDTVGSVTDTALQTLQVTPNLEGMWSTLSAEQRGGITMQPDLHVEDGGFDAGEVMTAIGNNTVVPRFNPPMIHAARLLADLPLGVTAQNPFVACPEGGTTQVVPITSDQNFINYDNCRIGGFTLYGGVGMAPYTQLDGRTNPPTLVPIPSEARYYQLAPDRFRIILKSVKVTGNGTPEPGGEAYPNNAYAWTEIECKVVGSAKTCSTNFQNYFLWGNDVAWTNWSDNGTAYPAVDWNLFATDDRYLLNGTFRPCESDPVEANLVPGFCQTRPPAPAARHIKFDNMTNNSGRAIVYGDNGWSVVTRLPPVSPGVEKLRVQRTLVQAVTVHGVTYPVGPGPVEHYQCTVGRTTGYYDCVQVQ